MLYAFLTLTTAAFSFLDCMIITIVIAAITPITTRVIKTSARVNALYSDFTPPRAGFSVNEHYTSSFLVILLLYQHINTM